MSDIEKLLINEESNDVIFEMLYEKVKIHKERFDNRFTILYVKDYNEGLKQNNYTVGGYFDVKDKIIYGCDYTIRKILSNQTIISIKSFDDLEKEFINKIEEYIEKYSFKNKKELESLAFYEYSNSDDYKIKSYNSDIRRFFIINDNIEVELPKFYSENDFICLENYKNKNVFIEYLNNAEKTVSKYANLIIDNNKDNLGLALLLYDDEIKLLNKIKMNCSYEFNDLHMKRKMYNSIKNINAKKLNITIMYNKKALTFKYDYHVLKRALANDEDDGYGFGVAYNKVSEFIKENTPNNQHSRYNEDFEFSHIISITYGKKELYKKDDYIKSKKYKERER